MTYLKRIIVPILIICLVGLITGPILIYPNQAKAAEPVSIVADSDQPFFTQWRASWGKWILGDVKEEVWNDSKKMVEWALGTFLNTLLHKLLTMLTNDIVNWIQNGEEPRFISKGLSSYLWDVADQAGGDFIENYLGLGWMCEPFEAGIKVALLDIPTFEDKVTCTLTDVVENIDDFYNDFSAGGWAGWIELTKPQNNFFGEFLLAQEEQIMVEEKAKAQAEFDALTGSGFLSMRDCTWYDKDGKLIKTQKDVIGQPRMPSACTPDKRPCTYECETLTPSSVIDETAKKTTTNYLDQLNAQIAAATAKAGPFAVYVQAIINALINRVTTEGVGLLRTGTSKDPKKKLTEPDYYDLGAATSTPAITNPADIMEEKNDANFLVGQLEVLKSEVIKIKANAITRIANLEAAIKYYNEHTKPALRALSTCGLPGSKKWADKQLARLDNSVIPDIQKEIDQLNDYLETNEGQDMAAAISDAIALINTFISKADDWLDVWEKVRGNAKADLDENETPDLEEAEEEMDEARDAAIEKIQEIVTAINGSCSSSDFSGLTEEVGTSIERVIQKGEELNANPNDTSELTAAKELEAEADAYGRECKDYEKIKKDLQEGLDAVKKAVDDIEIDVNVNVTQ